ncbi:MAG: thioredoxin family protein [Gemmatimonadetes bacterium]|nr:thioredoxin family protein [Gemmatimonadota bacterium]
MRRIVLALVFVLAAATSSSAADLKKEPFSPERFAALQAQGELVLLDVFASWCPTCAEQQKILSAYRQEHPDVKLHILEINFDTDKQWVRQFRAPRQSTLILFRGPQQLWYSVAETRPDVIVAALTEGARRR